MKNRALYPLPTTLTPMLSSMTAYSALAILLTTTASMAQQDNAERLAEFIQAAPPIREMVVECDWYAGAG